MENKIKFLFMSLILLSCATAQKVDLKALQKQIAELQNEVKELKASNEAQKNSQQKQIDELYERADANEFAATLNKVKMGLDFSVGGSNVHSKMGGVKSNNENKWASEIHLNLSANINDRTRFTGRIAMAKYWGNMGHNYLVNDYDQGRNPQGNSVLYLDRAYIDYDIIPGTLIATIGRQPGTDGPGSNLRNNSARMSTYPAMLVNAMGDALVLTYKPEAFKDYKLALRTAFVKYFQGSEISDRGTHLLEGWGKKDSNLFYLSAEGELPLGEFGKNLAILSYIHGSKYSLPIEVKTPGGSMDLINSVYNLGTLDALNLHFESFNTFNSPFSWFISASYFNGSNAMDNSNAIRSEVAKNLVLLTGLGEIMENSGLVPNAKAVANAAVMEYANAIIGSGELDWNNKSAWAIHLGARYDFTQSFKLGAEFFHGSKYWFAMSRPGVLDPLDFRNTKGNVYDIYAIWQIDFNQYLRFSYTHVDYHYSNSGRPIGTPIKVSDKADVFSVIYNVRF